MSVLAVHAGGAEFGIPADRVREVLRPPPLTRVPAPPPGILGVAQVRGTVLAVMDLGARLGMAPVASDGRLVVVWGRGREAVGLLVDRVVGLAEAEDGESAPPAEAEAALPAGWLAGVSAPAPGRRVALLHLERVLGEEAT
ncbi:chemotaxis protein CheW [Longimicrobium terrae]|uniref:Chemotaxis signal transduction protein n=1 Tax=Longimicrobium terrae TaxID=1639882 RepID=A0A841H6I7_9BACT|nr:chemotaxis signal transduction protein [Longimicrobium terrae]MBB6073707.1 chemotaxis signal transduction protein [Longimicrobium terrae]NNC30652.1 chemotaxis protein CheW [Longimicrobium terrae]